MTTNQNTDPAGNPEDQEQQTIQDPQQGQPPETKTDVDDKPKDKTFTQEDVNGLVAKEAKKAQEKILRDLGMTDFENAKDGLQKFKEWQDSQKTDAEREKEEREQLSTKAQQAEERAQLLEAKIKALEFNVNPDDLEDVLTLARAKGSDDIGEAIKSVIERYPHFTKQENQSDQKTSPPKWTSGQHKKDSPDTDPFVATLFGKKN